MSETVFTERDIALARNLGIEIASCSRCEAITYIYTSGECQLCYRANAGFKYYLSRKALVNSGVAVNKKLHGHPVGHYAFIRTVLMMDCL